MLRNLLLKLTLKTPSRLNIQTNQLYKDFKNCQTTKISFGEKNKDKVFYIIKRSPGAGFFSNVLFVAVKEIVVFLVEELTGKGYEAVNKICQETKLHPKQL